MRCPQFQFGNVVVVPDCQIGVICKTWGGSQSRPHHYDVYVRSLNAVREYDEDQIRHYIYSKELTAEQIDFHDLP